MKACEVESGARREGCQTGDEIQWFEHNMGGAIAERLLEPVHDQAVAIAAEALERERRASNVATQAFELLSLELPTIALHQGDRRPSANPVIALLSDMSEGAFCRFSK